MATLISVQGSRGERPTGLFIVVVLEVLAGVRYLLDILIYPTLDLTSALLVALMLISFFVAYGLWHFAKWAWILSLVLSLFGVLSTTFLISIGGPTPGLLFQSIPSIIIDVVVIIILISRGVRGMFWGRKDVQHEEPIKAPQNP